MANKCLTSMLIALNNTEKKVNTLKSVLVMYLDDDDLLEAMTIIALPEKERIAAIAQKKAAIKKRWDLVVNRNSQNWDKIQMLKGENHDI